MAPPAVHEHDRLLDHARSIWVLRGQEGVTLTALATAADASPGSVRSTFGTRSALLAMTWLREAQTFQLVQSADVRAAARSTSPTGPLLAAAMAYVGHAREQEDSARLLLLADLGDLVVADLDGYLRHEMAALRRLRGQLIVTLADQMWGERDVGVCRVVQHCIEVLPRSLLVRDGLTSDAAARDLETSVRLIADAVLSGPRHRPA